MNNYTSKETNEGTTWYYNDKRELHRLDGPAIESTDWENEWYVNGKRHRLDGPAVVAVNCDYKGWYVNGKEYIEEEFNRLFYIPNQTYEKINNCLGNGELINPEQIKDLLIECRDVLKQIISLQ